MDELSQSPQQAPQPPQHQIDRDEAARAARYAEWIEREIAEAGFPPVTPEQVQQTTTVVKHYTARSPVGIGVQALMTAPAEEVRESLIESIHRERAELLRLQQALIDAANTIAAKDNEITRLRDEITGMCDTQDASQDRIEVLDDKVEELNKRLSHVECFRRLWHDKALQLYRERNALRRSGQTLADLVYQAISHSVVMPGAGQAAYVVPGATLEAMGKAWGTFQREVNS